VVHIVADSEGVLMCVVHVVDSEVVLMLVVHIVVDSEVVLMRIADAEVNSGKWKRLMVVLKDVLNLAKPIVFFFLNFQNVIVSIVEKSAGLLVYQV
jgi:hypothetical protein